VTVSATAQGLWLGFHTGGVRAGTVAVVAAIYQLADIISGN